MRSPVTRLLVCVVLVASLLGPSVSTARADPTEPFTIAVIPDTQIYVQSESGSALFQAQFDWIEAQHVDQNIVFVSHVGDVSQNPSSTTEWDRIETVF